MSVKLLVLLVSWVVASPLLAVLVGKATHVGQQLDAGRLDARPESLRPVGKPHSLSA